MIYLSIYNTVPPVTLTPSSVAINVADELSECDKRKCNIVVHNLPKTTSDNHSDINSLEICQKSLNLDVKVTKSIQLGQKQNSKPHSLLLKLSDEFSHNQVLTLAPKLRISGTWEHVNIQPDMTPSE